MTIVQIYVKTPSQTGLLYTINEERIRAASTTIDSLLAEQPYAPVKKVEITGAAPAAFRFVLDCIIEHEQTKRRPDDELRIKAHNEPIAKTTAIYEAIEALGIKPRQPHIENHIIGHIAHNTLKPDELITIHKTFEPRRETSKTWRTLAHQTAYNIVYQKYTPEKAGALQKAVVPYPELCRTIEEKMANEVFPRKALEDESQAIAESGTFVSRGGRHASMSRPEGGMGRSRDRARGTAIMK